MEAREKTHSDRASEHAVHSNRCSGELRPLLLDPNRFSVIEGRIVPDMEGLVSPEVAAIMVPEWMGKRLRSGGGSIGTMDGACGCG